MYNTTELECRLHHAVPWHVITNLQTTQRIAFKVPPQIATLTNNTVDRDTLLPQDTKDAHPTPVSAHTCAHTANTLSKTPALITNQITTQKHHSTEATVLQRRPNTQSLLVDAGPTNRGNDAATPRGPHFPLTVNGAKIKDGKCNILCFFVPFCCFCVVVAPF